MNQLRINKRSLSPTATVISVRCVHGTEHTERRTYGGSQMRRQVSPERLPGGVWLKLECGHDRSTSHRTDGGVECSNCDLRWIPPEARLDRRTPTFTSNTVPEDLLSGHKSSAWAKLVVTSGDVTFVDEQPQWRTTVNSRRPVVIVPGRCHHIEPQRDAEFHMEFYSLDNSMAA